MATNAGTIKTLLVDNYDSYTFNLFQYLAEVNGEEPDVIKNNEHDASKILHDVKSGKYDNIVISPGPGIPSNEQDFGLCAALIREATVPILGVCLGYQGIAIASGGQLVRSPRIIHGEVGTMRHNEDPLFNGVPTRFDAVRYHSWIVASPLPSDLEPIAWCEEVDSMTGTRTDIVMALRHKSKPLWGVLFHPESICTPHGKQILKNFVYLSTGRTVLVPDHSLAPLEHKNNTAQVQHLKYSAKHLTKQSWAIFEHLFSGITGAEKFWLDSSRAEAGLSRFSYMGAMNGPLSETLRYELRSKTVTIATAEREVNQRLHDGQDFFSFVRDYLHQKGSYHDESLPFDLQCGLVGYFGYEMKHEALAAPDTPQQISSLPDAYLLFADRLVVIDHQLNDIYVVALISGASNEDWMHSTLIQIQQLDVVELSSNTPNARAQLPLRIQLHSDYETYTAQISESLKQIELGESYELCLTNQLVIEGCAVKPLEFYNALRAVNPAPYASFFEFKNFAVVSSSPEKFLSVDRHGLVESKPIKGTMKRGATAEEDRDLKQQLQTSKKDFSENLMITDLIRNDLGRVCQIGSVRVPKLMDVESYATVHQLVTTVQGQLSPQKDAVECFKAAFPPGSMTGAPKLRSTQILEKLEGRPRGVYSGAIGFFSLNQTCHFNVVIRTAIVQENSISIGCGGALVMESNADGEFDEMLLKGRALVRTIARLSGATDDIHIRGTAKFNGVKYLEDLSTKSGALDLSLDRIKRVLSILHDPQERVPMIHVTGTNGKGSVCAYISSVLLEKGLKVGRFTSPHLIRWHECIQINNLDIDNDELNDVLCEVYQVTQQHGAPLSQFEALTVAAYLHFYKSNCDINVIEVGMGGRDDATNVCSSPLVCAITSIGLDHMAFLGNTHAKIARNKAGIIKTNRPCVISGRIITEAREAIEDYANSIAAPLHVVDAPATLLDESSQLAEFDGLKYRLPLLGEHQLMNSALAIATLRVLATVSPDKFKLTDSDIANGMFRVRWPARLQFIVWNNKRVLIDGAHNEEGGRALRRYVNTLKAHDGSPMQINWITGMLSSKDHSQFFKETLTPADSLCVVPVVPNVDWLFSADPRTLVQKALDVCPQLRDVAEHASVYEALDAITAQDDSDDFAQHTNRLIVVSGSLHLCGNVLARAVNFSLLETLLFDPALPGGSAIFLLDEHLNRLSKSAQYFNVPINPTQIRQQLLQQTSKWNKAKRIRILIHLLRNNELEIQSADTSFEFDKYPSATIKLAKHPISKRNTFLYHKTTHRSLYEEVKRSDCDDVILYNEEGKVTETTIGNIAVQFNDAIWYTPPVSCGLLPGCMRQHLLQKGSLVERVISIAELKAAARVKLFNSVRGSWSGIFEAK